jgi:hypothetical protein
MYVLSYPVLSTNTLCKNGWTISDTKTWGDFPASQGQINIFVALKLLARGPVEPGGVGHRVGYTIWTMHINRYPSTPSQQI